MSENSTSPRRLLVITGDSMDALLAKGHDAGQMLRYYNPANHFDEVRILNWFEAAGSPVPLLDVPVAADFRAWREAFADPWVHDEISEESLRQTFPGLSQAWIDAVREFAPQCIRAYDPSWPGLVANELGRALGIPVLVSVHNMKGICGGVAQKADSVMCVSEGVAQRCIRLGVDASKVVTVFNRVDRELFSPTGSIADGPTGAPKLLCIAREHPQKNLDRLLTGCRSAQKHLPELQLVHVGHSTRDWSDTPFVTHLESVPHVELPVWMRWADALVLPSLYEGFGVVLAEALACGTPCITSDRPPMNEIVTDKWDGLLVDPENISKIEEAIRAIADPSLQARLSAPARTSSERFDIGVVEQREAALYHTMSGASWARVSVVMPTYNRAGRIEAAVRNVLAQEYPDFELIVVNDGSTDETAEILARIDDKRLTVVTRDNGGVPHALNTGFAKASGEYWTWTSDDNALRPGALMGLARELRINPEAGFVFADMEVRQGDERRHFAAGPIEKLNENNVIGACFMYRASVAKTVGEYDPKYTLAEDYDYWLRMRKQTEFVHLRRVLYEYHDVPDSLTRRRFTQVQEARMQLLKRENADSANQDAVMYDHFCRYAATSKQYGLPRASLMAAWQALRLRPGARQSWWALLRALTPKGLLNLTRRMRGLDVS